LVNVIVGVVLNCLLKLFAVDKSITTLPPVPKSEYVSLNVVDAIYPVTSILPVCVIFPVNPNVVPSKVKFDSA